MEYDAASVKDDFFLRPKNMSDRWMGLYLYHWLRIVPESPSLWTQMKAQKYQVDNAILTLLL